MNKTDLIEKVAADTKASKSDVESILKSILENIKKTVKKEEPVQLIGFGSFGLVHRKARVGRNPQTGEEIKIKASKSVSFKAGKAFKESL
ncbi:DNA-binding protein [PVC group bacterium (ex Bugula neritina AB1)]|nr:DNA-binding protein [PVC group bacterium (ex Bugula neritina AB1)]